MNTKRQDIVWSQASVNDFWFVPHFAPSSFWEKFWFICKNFTEINYCSKHRAILYIFNRNIQLYHRFFLSSKEADPVVNITRKIGIIGALLQAIKFTFSSNVIFLHLLGIFSPRFSNYTIFLFRRVINF